MAFTCPSIKMEEYFMKLRFAVIGYGFIGRRHVDTLKSFEESDCVAVCDINRARLDEVKKYILIWKFTTMQMNC